MHYLVALVIDLAHQLFDDVFQGDHALCAAVLVYHNGKVCLGVLHIPENVADALGVRHVDHILGDLCQRLELAAQEPEKVLVGNHANDVVHVLFVYRKPGKVIVQKHLLCLFDGGIRRQGDHPDTWNQYLADRGLIELQSGDHQIAFLFFQNALFLDLVNDVFQLVLRDAGRILLGSECTGKYAEQQHERRHQQSKLG